MNKQCLLTVLLLLGPLLSVFGQKQIKGKIIDIKGEPIAAVTVTLKLKDDSILSFGFSTEKGLFSLTMPELDDNVFLTASAIGYEKKTITIAKGPDKDYEFVLLEREINLETVEIKNRPVLVINGDTLNYITADFSSAQDRTIADVLKKLPGMQIEDDGKIKFNGKGISNLYIDGDNMLNDRYNVGTKIPHGAVAKVQVIEKDQPVKLLRKNNISRDVAINLVIKDEAKLDIIKEAGLGIGTPKKVDGNFTAMSFGEKLKFIYNLTGNNIGADPGIEITAHNRNNHGNENNKHSNFLSTGTGGNPPLPQSRYLFNKSELINLNNFYKINKDLDAKVNFSYLYHQEHQNVRTSSDTYLNNGQTVSYGEVQQSKVIQQKLYADLNITGNTDNYFLSNSMILSYEPKKINSGININNVYADQVLRQKMLDISNELNYRKKLKSSNTLNFYSYLNSTMQPESLKIRPGVNDSILNSGLPYAGLNQQLRIPTLFTDNHLSYGVVRGRFTQYYKTGFNVQNQQFTSDLYSIQNDGADEPVKNMNNDLHWLKLKIYTEASYEYSGQKLKAALNLPVGYNSIRFNDSDKGLDRSLNRVFVNPSLNLDYKLGLENYVSADYSFNNKFGGIDDVYKGGILKNYRSIFANDAPVSEQKKHHAGAAFKFKKPLQMFMFGISASYEHTIFNTISSYILADNLQKKIVLPVKNQSNAWSFELNGSKYLFDIRSTVNGSVNYSLNNFKQMQNGVFEPFNTSAISYSLGIESRLMSFINWSYKGNYSAINNVGGNNAQIRINPKQFNQKSTLTATAFKSLFISLSGEHRFTRQAGQLDLSYLFTDFNLRYVFVKFKTNLEFSVTNLANIKKFETIDFSPNALTLSSYRIPGRVMMIKSTFNF
ncbi:hypothetical protein N180_04625 [Pedobacter antarcticus 4BY]|uniref:TonB-dependent receptor n=2 Tax=Pedobacter antarcticus TaxID=34086 RepID=A0A081PDB2_9SPHI|nr:hypothetical protein [Pedobacter antarcticus]KEQ28685.1 hypothetical protein N180_04625 [Pedobacter antarcticus 4BY]SFE88832.1 hypothetical protein SAMN03003324_01668 [Pedobacter antarcticus]